MFVFTVCLSDTCPTKHTNANQESASCARTRRMWLVLTFMYRLFFSYTYAFRADQIYRNYHMSFGWYRMLYTKRMSRAPQVDRWVIADGLFWWLYIRRIYVQQTREQHTIVVGEFWLCGRHLLHIRNSTEINQSLNGVWVWRAFYTNNTSHFSAFKKLKQKCINTSMLEKWNKLEKVAHVHGLGIKNRIEEVET